MFKKLLLGLSLLFLPSLALAQGCGNTNPNCIVPTAPAGTSNNQAASTAFVQNAVSSPAVPFTLSPSGLTQGLIINGTPSGTQVGSFTENNILILNNAALTGATSFFNGLQITCGEQSTTVRGGLNCLYVTAGINSPTNASNANHNYVGITAVGQANTGDGGTNTAGGALGAIFATGFQATAINGATNLLEVSGGEIDCSLQTGSSARFLNCWSIVAASNHAVHGASMDTALSVGAQAGSIGFNTAFLLTSNNGIFPLASGGSVLTSDIAGTVTFGVDLANLTCITACFRSPGFVVDGSGDVTAKNLLLLGATSGTTQIQATAIASGVLTLPATTDTLVGKATTDTLTNKTIDTGTFSNTSTFTGQIAGQNTINSILSTNGALIAFNGSNQNAGASASVILGLATNAGAVSFTATSTAGGPFVDLQSTIGGTFFIDLKNATGAMSFRTGATPTEALNISAAGLLTVPLIATGTPVASVCIDASNHIIKKTTTGACI